VLEVLVRGDVALRPDYKDKCHRVRSVSYVIVGGT